MNCDPEYFVDSGDLFSQQNGLKYGWDQSGKGNIRCDNNKTNSLNDKCYSLFSKRYLPECKSCTSGCENCS